MGEMRHLCHENSVEIKNLRVAGYKEKGCWEIMASWTPGRSRVELEQDAEYRIGFSRRIFSSAGVRLDDDWLDVAISG